MIIGEHEKKVRVKTSIGCFEGTWCSPDPAEYKGYILELDSDDVLTFEMIKISNIDIAYINQIDDKIYLNGKVEKIQNEILFLRLHKSIMMLEISMDLDFSVFINQYVEITIRSINLFDVGI